MKKVLIFDFSPRKGGNSDVITERLAAGIQDAEIKTVKYREDVIAPCKACNACKAKETPFCIQKDVMGGMLEEIDQCDALVMVGPIYFGRLSAPELMFIDRIYPFYNPAKETMSNATKFGKKIAFVCTCGAGSAADYEAVANVQAATMGVAGFTESKVAVCDGINGVGEIADKPELMAKVEEVAAWI